MRSGCIGLEFQNKTVPTVERLPCGRLAHYLPPLPWRARGEGSAILPEGSAPGQAGREAALVGTDRRAG